MRNDRGQIVGVMIHIMADARLRGSAMTAAIVRDDSITVVQKKQHLRVPIVAA
jgi:hypothetical protein